MFAARAARDTNAGGGGGGGGAGGAGLSLALSNTIFTASGVPTFYTTPNITGTPSGGVGGNTFAWSVVENEYGCNVTFSAPGSNVSRVNITGIGLSDIIVVVVRLTVTDSAGNFASRDCTITYTNTDYR